MKKIIFLFLIFSAIVFAEWQYSISHNNYGVMFNEFTVFDSDTSSQLTVSMTTDIGSGYSSVTIFNEQIKNRNKYYLFVLSDTDAYTYNVFKKDIENGAIRVENTDGRRGNNLTKMLISARAVGLLNNKTEELLAFFDLEGLKEIIEQKLGNSDWYKNKINE